ncbi:hypothetical protein BDZ94DRAFT_1270791 [Collybia nuda]|uniref:Uncharacterized protein n=1 Tax=Collybia nuda TaxID=64659 RepID=A0A9P5XXH4_9AGAR|nr:hypothetical protein BDZ94DRAFT_1270791 [Collybia nuda]
MSKKLFAELIQVVMSRPFLVIPFISSFSVAPLGLRMIIPFVVFLRIPFISPLVIVIVFRIRISFIIPFVVFGITTMVVVGRFGVPIVFP